jgi:hypothetical protein
LFVMVVLVDFFFGCSFCCRHRCFQVLDDSQQTCSLK